LVSGGKTTREGLCRPDFGKDLIGPAVFFGGGIAVAVFANVRGLLYPGGFSGEGRIRRALGKAETAAGPRRAFSNHDGIPALGPTNFRNPWGVD
jgi:hypothetical protein